jgi:transcription elongation factor GreA-like protein
MFVRSRSQKSMRTQPSILLSFFCTRHGNTEREIHGVSFKLFSHYIKAKILSSDLVLFTLIKVFEENVRWAIVYHFFGLVEIFYEKRTERFLF